nr:putative reverse transcriptase, RNA-dependent DNA polymerase [Tanacetum cinerariifolium]
MEAVEIVSEGYVLLPRSNRGVPPKRYSPEKDSRWCKYPVANIAEGNLSKGAKAFISSLYSNEVPTTIEQALKSRQCRKAMEDEMRAVNKNKTWETCVLPLGKKIVGCRWVFTIKYNPDGTIERYKARLVAKGYTQTYGIDYSKTFSPYHHRTPTAVCHHHHSRTTSYSPEGLLQLQ